MALCVWLTLVLVHCMISGNGNCGCNVYTQETAVLLAVCVSNVGLKLGHLEYQDCPDVSTSCRHCMNDCLLQVASSCPKISN